MTMETSPSPRKANPLHCEIGSSILSKAVAKTCNLNTKKGVHRQTYFLKKCLDKRVHYTKFKAFIFDNAPKVKHWLYARNFYK